MKKIALSILLLIAAIASLFAQVEQNFSAINPALFLYTPRDVYVKSPVKYQNGKQIITPNPTLYPWEAQLENGMPNVIKTMDSNVSIYISSFVSYSATPPSKVGVIGYVNSTNDIGKWTRPDAGLYWYNAAGATADAKISPVFKTGYKPTNIVAVDIESVGIYDNREFDNTLDHPFKLIYLPQRESGNHVLCGYEMEDFFTDQYLLADFALMKNDRLEKQKNFRFKFINGDTHMNYLRQNGKWYFVSRLNSKRSSLKAGEKLPFSPDPRIRYRRETITEVGPTLESKDVDLQIALDMSNTSWEPYSMQPFRLGTSFEEDIWWGLVTMYGTESDKTNQYRQRTELAFSNDGVHWRYVKPGTPFLDNGTDPKSDDHGCINIAKPVRGLRFTGFPGDVFFFYASSNQRHVSGRNPGISVATGVYGKMAGLHADATQATFYSTPSDPKKGLPKDSLPQFSLPDAFRPEAQFYPGILADVTDDPRGKTLSSLNSYAAVLMYAYDETADHGLGALLAGTLGSSQQGTHTISDSYEAVGFIKNGIDGATRGHLLKYVKAYSTAHPTQIVSIKEFKPIPMVWQALLKNATLYGLQFHKPSDASYAVNLDKASRYSGGSWWVYEPPQPTKECHTLDFSNEPRLPNQTLPVDKENGTMAVKVVPQASSIEQTVLRMYGDEGNYLGLYYDSSNGFTYRIVKDNTEFASMTVSPPPGQSFNGKNVILSFEAVKPADRKMAPFLKEEAAVFGVTCPELSFSASAQQPILWNWKHASGSITPSDSANARAFAFNQFAAFIGDMKYMTVGGKNNRCESPFAGQILKVEFADRLPSNGSFFWTEPVTKSSSSPVDETITQTARLYANEVAVYPNPVRQNENLHIDVHAEKSTRVYVQIYDLSGRLKKNFTSEAMAGEPLTYYVNDLATGYYIVRVFTDEFAVSKKISIIR